MKRGVKQAQERAQFFSILSDGKFHTKSEEGVDGAIKRDYKNKEGEEMSVWELLYEELTGKIVGIDTKEQEYGTMLYVTLNIGSDDAPNNIVISISARGNFGTELLKKLPNVDISKDVQISPYAIPKTDRDDKPIMDKNGEQLIGKYVVIQQEVDGNKVKIDSYFQEGKGKDTKDINGFPSQDPEALKAAAAEGEASRKLYWTTYFAKITIFLVNYVMEHHRLIADDQKVEEAHSEETKEAFDAPVAPAKPGLQAEGETSLAEDAEAVMAEQEAEEKAAAAKA